MALESIIVIHQVSKQFKGSLTKNINCIDFQVLNSEKIGIFGPNGAGKTTLISMMCGLSKPDTGSIHYQIDKQITTIHGILYEIGYVPQEYAFFQELTPVQNLAYFGALQGLSKIDIKSRTAHLLEVLGLELVAKKKINTFSGGMKRRLNLAIGMIHNPRILFLDEPTVGVDVQSKMAIMQYLEELNKQGTTIIYTSHHLKEAEEFCDRILLMDHGQLIALDTMEHLQNEHHVADLEDFFIKLTGSEYRD